MSNWANIYRYIFEMKVYKSKVLCAVCAWRLGVQRATDWYVQWKQIYVIWMIEMIGAQTSWMDTEKKTGWVNCCYCGYWWWWWWWSSCYGFRGKRRIRISCCQNPLNIGSWNKSGELSHNCNSEPLERPLPLTHFYFWCLICIEFELVRSIWFHMLCSAIGKIHEKTEENKTRIIFTENLIGFSLRYNLFFDHHIVCQWNVKRLHPWMKEKKNLFCLSSFVE